jgi:hypothetical protein
MGIEVLPIVPAVYEGMDRMGREYVTGLADWVEWIAKVKGRGSIRELAGTAGQRRGDDRVNIVYNRQFASMKNRMWEEGKEGEWRGRGNRLDLVKGPRVEVELRMLEPPKEIGEMMRKSGGGDSDEERVRRETNENGMSVECEFTFVNAIGRFTRRAGEEEYFHGERVRNVREQLAMRARFEGQGRVKKYITAVGASVMGRMMDEIDKVGSQVVMVGPTVKVKGEWGEEKLMWAMEEIGKCEVEPDYVFVFGPGNDMVVHGRAEARGTGGEKKLVMEGEGKIRAEYHLTEPARRTKKEKEQMVNLVYGLLRGIKKISGNTQVVYVGLFPRHIDLCCRENGHMRGEDVMMMHNERRDFDQAVRDKVGEEFECWTWHEVLGIQKEPTVKEIRERRIVGRDGVHLERVWNRRAAVQMCCKMVEEAVMVKENEGAGEKKGRNEV